MAESPKFSRLKRNRGRGTRWWRHILDRKWKYGRFAHAQWKICNKTLIYGRIDKIFASFRKSGSGNTMVTSDFSPEVEIRPFRAYAMHPAIIIGTVRSLWAWTWLWGRYHVPQNAFLVFKLMLNSLQNDKIIQKLQIFSCHQKGIEKPISLKRRYDGMISISAIYPVYR